MKTIFIFLVILSSCSTYNKFTKSEKVHSEYEAYKSKLDLESEKRKALDYIYNKQYENELVSKYSNDVDIKPILDLSLSCEKTISKCKSEITSISIEDFLSCKNDLKKCTTDFRNHSPIITESRNLLIKIEDNQRKYFEEKNLSDGKTNIIFENSQKCEGGVKYGYFIQDLKTIKKVGRLDYWDASALNGRFDSLEKCEEDRAVKDNYLSEKCEWRYVGKKIATTIYSLKVFNRKDLSSYSYEFSNIQDCESSLKNGFEFLNPLSMKQEIIGADSSNAVLKFIGKCEKKNFVNCESNGQKINYSQILK